MDWQGAWCGPKRTACWLIGGGPSLNSLPTDRIAASPLPKFAINLAGHGHFRPTFWTSYDPTSRFHPSIYLDPSIFKFVHTARAMDLIPGTTFKVCESPSLYFFERDRLRGFNDFLQPGEECSAEKDTITDWQDSFIQAIAITWQLGFRVLYLAGCDMQIRPSREQLDRAMQAGVDFRSGEPLKEFFARCGKAGLSRQELERLAAPEQYHFDETKPLAAAVQTDWHYFRVAQYLRLSRRALAGLELISVTPDSRLNEFLEYRPIDEVLATIHRTIGDPAQETTRGRYTSTAGEPRRASMRDFPPHNWPARGCRPGTEKIPDEPLKEEAGDPRKRLRTALQELPEVAVPLDEVG